jgi:hypothetical protein
MLCGLLHVHVKRSFNSSRSRKITTAYWEYVRLRRAVRYARHIVCYLCVTIRTPAVVLLYLTWCASIWPDDVWHKSHASLQVMEAYIVLGSRQRRQAYESFCARTPSSPGVEQHNLVVKSVNAHSLGATPH